MKTKYNFLYEVPDHALPTDYHHNSNVVECVAEIIKKYRSYDEVVCCAEMQAGKTNAIKRLIYVISKYNDHIQNLGIDISKYKIYLVICASSINLKNQLKSALPEIKHRIYHLNDINTFLKNPVDHHSTFVEMSDSSLIIFDECHCDAAKDKLIDKFRKTLDKFRKEFNTMYHKLSVSATPYAQIIAGYPKVILKPAKHYYGIRQIN